MLAVGDEYCVQIRAMLTLESDNGGLIKRELCRQHVISEKSFSYWLRKLRGQMAEATGPRLVPLDSAPIAEDMLQIQYRGTELKLPADVDIAGVAALLRSLQTL